MRHAACAPCARGGLDRRPRPGKMEGMKHPLAALLLCLGLAAPLAAAPNSQEMREKIAARIWKNECGGTVGGLVSWNKGEEFPSLGIGHFIWYPPGVKGRFEESFPEFVRYAESKGVRVPSVAKGAAPWPDRSAFLKADAPGGKAAQLRQWLAGNTSLQADFIIRRSVAALKRMEAASDNPALIRERYAAVASTAQGMYALIDYVNFKGEGTNPDERYKGEGWGLLQVLEGMDETGRGASAASAFSRSAKRVLQRRVANSPSARGERRWLAGWMNRCETYAKPF